MEFDGRFRQFSENLDDFEARLEGISNVREKVEELESFFPAAREEIDNLKSTIDSDIEEKLKHLAKQYEDLLGKLDEKIEPVRLELNEKFRQFSESLDTFEAKLEGSGDVRAKVKEIEGFLPAAKQEIENLKSVINSDIKEKLKPLTEQYKYLSERIDLKIKPVRMEFDGKFRQFSERLDTFETSLEKSGEVREKVKELESFLPVAKEEIENLKSTIDLHIEKKLKPLTDQYKDISEKLEVKIELIILELDGKFRQLSEGLDSFEVRLEKTGEVRDKVKELESFLPAAKEEIENLKSTIEWDIEKKLKPLTEQYNGLLEKLDVKIEPIPAANLTEKSGSFLKISIISKPGLK